MRIIFIGPPGAGKGTQSGRLVRYLDVPHLSTGDMLRKAKAEGSSLGKKAAEYMDNGLLVPDSMIVHLLGERLQEPDCERGCLFDGFPRTIGQAAALDDYLRQLEIPLDVVVAMEVEEDELVRRLSERARDDDRPELIRQRLQDYEAQTRPLLEYYQQQGLLQRVSGQGTPDEVFERIQDVVDGISARRA